MFDLIPVSTAYMATLEPLSTGDLEQIPCHSYVNLNVAEHDLNQFDKMFVSLRAKPQCFSISNRGYKTFYVPYEGREVFVDWRVYCTWANTFHLRFEEGLKAFAIKHTNPHIHPEKQFLLATWMASHGKSPKPLAQCVFLDVAQPAF